MSHYVVHSIPFETRLKHHAAKDILAHDQARAQRLSKGLHPHGPLSTARHRGLTGDDGETMSAELAQPQPVPPAGDPEAAQNSIDVTNAGVTYTMSVGIGEPATDYTLLIDTGSSNTWIGADKKYTPTSTSHNTGNKVIVTFGSGSFSGPVFTDQVTIGHFVIKNQSIAVSSKVVGFRDGVDGILGIGPVDLTVGTVTNTATVPTVTDNMLEQKLIPTETIGISYEPTTKEGEMNGSITFGNVDKSRFTGDIHYVPITKTSPANKYWGIDQVLTYGKTTTILKGNAGIMDTGTTLLLIATDAFHAYQKATGATEDKHTGLFTVTEAQFEKLQSLFFKIGDTTFEFTPNAQIWPRALNATIGGGEGKIYLITGDLGSNSGQGLDFINGFAFLQRFYSVYDTSGSRIGIAPTQFTNATSN